MEEYEEYVGMLPRYMHESILAYISQGRPPGHFLSALFSNDLMETYTRADETNMAAIRTYVIYLYNHAPAGCYGSRENFKAWCEHRGLEGLQHQQQKENPHA